MAMKVSGGWSHGENAARSHLHGAVCDDDGPWDGGEDV